MPTTTRPPGSLSGSATRVLLATVILHRPTTTTVAEATGLSRARTYTLLTRLRDRGLVTWEPGTVGTLRPCVDVVW